MVGACSVGLDGLGDDTLTHAWIIRCRPASGDRAAPRNCFDHRRPARLASFSRFRSVLPKRRRAPNQKPADAEYTRHFLPGLPTI